MRKKQTPHISVVLNFWKCSLPYTETENLCILHSINKYTDDTKMLLSEPRAQSSGHINPLLQFSFFGEPFPCPLFSGGMMKYLPIYPFLLGRHSEQLIILMERPFTYSQPCHLSADLNIVKRLVSNSFRSSKFGLKFDRGGKKSTYRRWNR